MGYYLPKRQMKKNQTEILVKNSMNEMKNPTESIGNRADQMEERINDLGDRDIEIIQLEEERELRFLKSE